MKEKVVQLYHIRCTGRKLILQADNWHRARLAHNAVSQVILDLFIYGSISYGVAMHICKQYDEWLKLRIK